MLPREPKTPMIIDTDKLRALSEAVDEKFSPFDREDAPKEVTDIAYAFNVSVALKSCAAEIDRLRAVERQTEQLRESAAKHIQQAAVMGHALAILVLRNEQRRERQERIQNSPAMGAMSDFIKFVFERSRDVAQAEEAEQAEQPQDGAAAAPAA